MTKRRHTRPLTALLLWGLALPGCGIDRGGAPVNIEVTVLADAIDDAIVGPISSKSDDAIVINDTTVVVRDALIRRNGRSADLSLLEPGYYASVQARFTDANNAVATLVDVDFEAIGPITNVAGNDFDILGQRVIVADDSVIDDSLTGLDLADSAQVAAVQVSGYADGAGQVVATHVALNNDDTPRLTGFVTDVLDGTLSLTIGDQTVDYSQASLIALFAAAPAVGGRLTMTFDAVAGGNTLNAATLVSAPLLSNQLADGAIVSLAGFVTGFIAPDDFAVAFVSAQLPADARVVNGAAAELAAGRLVQVTGTYTADQTLVVSTLEYID